MKITQESEEAKRKLLKPQVERRRRERMNQSLENLKSLLLKGQESTKRRLEKAEILEHTVLFLQSNATGGGGGQKLSYQDGSSACLQRAAEFLGPEGKGLWLRAALDAAAAARFARSQSESAGVKLRTEACLPNALLLRRSSMSILQMMMYRSKHSPRACASSANRFVPTQQLSSPQGHANIHQQTLQQNGFELNMERQTAKQSPSPSSPVSQSVWRPWP
ncbi:hairy and enhancer of split related-7 [Genypterus blacodes]|uniref:hairy and enhancer of split related-7 n=1 Tax=Genypterus blacodes TaxID=154954 RepID=UPI003F759309